MYQSLQSLFQRVPHGWEDADIRHHIQEYLRRRLSSEAIYCDNIQRRAALVRVGTPALRQAAQLLEFDVIQSLPEEARQAVGRLQVKIEH